MKKDYVVILKAFKAEAANVGLVINFFKNLNIYEVNLNDLELQEWMS